MKLSTTLVTGAAFLLASCGPKTLALPAEPVDRAATCGVVAAAEARAATPDITQPLPFTAQGRILHYALLAGATGEEFSAEAATRVNARMSELQEEITGGKWEELGPACRAAFPVVENEDVTLPEDRFDAQLGCDEIGDFMSAALRSQARISSSSDDGPSRPSTTNRMRSASSAAARACFAVAPASPSSLSPMPPVSTSTNGCSGSSRQTP